MDRSYQGKIVVVDTLKQQILGVADFRGPDFFILNPVCPHLGRQHPGTDKMEVGLTMLDPITVPEEVQIGFYTVAYPAGKHYEEMHKRFVEDLKLKKANIVMPTEAEKSRILKP